MLRCTLALIAVIGLVALPSSPAQAHRSTQNCGGTNYVPKPGGGYWTCTFDDEFNGTGLNPANWTVMDTATSGFHSGAECFVNSSNNVSVNNGYLTLTARREAAPFICGDPNGGNYTTQYTSGAVTAYGKFSQTYGRFEIRGSFPAATVAGLQSSLWLYPANSTYGGWPASGEIDIAEEYSEFPDRAIPYVHYNSAGDPNITNNNCLINNVAAFHTYALVWTSTSLTFQYDGATCLVNTWNPAAPLVAPQPFDQPFFVNLTQALGIGANAFDPTTTPLPASTQIDYVRIWG